MKTVIFDLDGTLANVDHRRRFKDDGAFDWKYFNDPENIKNDYVNEAVVDLYQNLGGKYKRVILSGRNKATFYQTRDWLDLNRIINYETIMLRKQDDYREDYIIKKEMLDVLIAKGHEIAFAIDDSNQIVELWRSHGITFFQCAKGDF